MFNLIKKKFLLFIISSVLFKLKELLFNRF